MSTNINSVGNRKDVCTIVKPYVCDICGLRFRSSKNLKSHMFVHSEEKPYECSICLKCFRNKSYLKRHYRIHTGEKPYSCDICQDRFSQVSHLKLHIRMHNGEKPHRCVFCERAFMFMSELKVHLRLHTNEKPYVCDFCQKAFRVRQGFELHKLTHSEEKPYSCDICSKKFRSKKSMQCHKSGQHDPTKERILKKKRPVKVKPAVKNLPLRTICPKPNLITATAIHVSLPLEVKEMPQANLNMTPQQKIAQWRNILPSNQKPKSNQTVSKSTKTQKKRHAAAPKTDKRVIQARELNFPIAPKSPVVPFVTVPSAPMVMLVTCPLIQTMQVLS